FLLIENDQARGRRRGRPEGSAFEPAAVRSVNPNRIQDGVEMWSAHRVDNFLRTARAARRREARSQHGVSMVGETRRRWRRGAWANRARLPFDAREIVVPGIGQRRPEDVS